MPNGKRGESRIEIKGREVILRPTFDALSTIEDELNKSIVDIVRCAGQAIDMQGVPVTFNLKMREVGVIIYQAVRVVPENKWLTREDVLEFVYHNLSFATAIAMGFLTVALAVNDNDPSLDQLKKK